MKNSDQFQFIGVSKLDAITELDKLFNGAFQLTGSLALVAWGVTRRDVKDLDIIVPSFALLRRWLKVENMEFEEWIDYELEGEAAQTEEQSGKATRVAFKVLGVDVCAFEDQPREFKVVNFMDGTKAQVCHPLKAIEAKKNFIAKYYDKEALSIKQVARLRQHSEDVARFYDFLNVGQC